MVRSRLISVGIVSLVGLVFGQMASGEDVVINTSASRLWSTVTNPTVVLPVPWPQGAVAATLVVPASGIFAGAEANLTKGVDSSYTLTLPSPTTPDTEYIVSPTIEFRNADGDTLAPSLKASLAVVCNTVVFKGTHVASFSWTDIMKGSYLLPKPADDASCQIRYGSSAVTSSIPENCAWISFSPRKSGAYSFSTFGKDDELSFSAMLNVLPDGLVLSIR